MKHLPRTTILAATGLAIGLASLVAQETAFDSRSSLAPLDAAEAAEQETIVLAVSGMT